MAVAALRPHHQWQDQRGAVTLFRTGTGVRQVESRGSEAFLERLSEDVDRPCGKARGEDILPTRDRQLRGGRTGLERGAARRVPTAQGLRHPPVAALHRGQGGDWKQRRECGLPERLGRCAHITLCRELLRIHGGTGRKKCAWHATTGGALRNGRAKAVPGARHLQDSTRRSQCHRCHRILGAPQLGMEGHGTARTGDAQPAEAAAGGRGIHLLAPACLERRPTVAQAHLRPRLLHGCQPHDAARWCLQPVDAGGARHVVRHLGHTLRTQPDLVEGWRCEGILRLHGPMPVFAATRSAQQAAMG